MYKTIDEIPACLRAMVEAGEKPRHGITFDCGFSHTEWHRAIDLCSGKPGWDEAPEWAQWLAQDADGEWWWFQRKPAAGFDVDTDWGNEIGNDALAKHGKAIGDWRDTLERRPTDHTNELLDGDAPVITATDFKANRLENALRDEVKTTTQSLRVTHEEGFIDVERLTGGGVMLTDQDGQEIQIKSKAVLEAISDAAYSLM